jgi:hypothetical protein
MASRKCAFTRNLPFVLVGQRSQSHLRLEGYQSGMQAGPPIAKEECVTPRYFLRFLGGRVIEGLADNRCSRRTSSSDPSRRRYANSFS